MSLAASFLLFILFTQSHQCISFTPRFSVVSKGNYKQGRLQINALESFAEAETFLDRILGTNCYTKALKDLQKDDCKSMNQELKSRFALHLANCQLVVQGQQPYHCNHREPLRNCIARLPDRENMLYIEFLTHADTMCLFLQNREFEKYTENMLNTLAHGANYANDQLSLIGSQTQKLAVDTTALRDMSQKAVDKLNQHTEMHQQFIVQLQTHHDESKNQLTSLSTMQTTAIKLAESSLHVSQKLEKSQESMNAQIQDGQSRITDLFSMLNEKAATLSAAQTSTISAQHALSSQLQALVDGSQNLHKTISTVAEYQRRSDAALITLLGKSYRFEDAVFYILGGLSAFVAGSIRSLQHARLPIFCLLALSLFMERFLVDTLHSLLDIDAVTGNVVLSIPTPSSWWWLGWRALQRTLFYDNYTSAELSFLTFDFKWAVRRLILFIAVLILVYVYWTYIDYEKQNRVVLQEIRDCQRKQEEILHEYRQELYKARMKELSKQQQQHHHHHASDNGMRRDRNLELKQNTGNDLMYYEAPSVMDVRQQYENEGGPSTPAMVIVPSPPVVVTPNQVQVDNTRQVAGEQAATRGRQRRVVSSIPATSTRTSTRKRQQAATETQDEKIVVTRSQKRSKNK